MVVRHSENAELFVSFLSKEYSQARGGPVPVRVEEVVNGETFGDDGD